MDVCSSLWDLDGHWHRCRGSLEELISYLLFLILAQTELRSKANIPIITYLQHCRLVLHLLLLSILRYCSRRSGVAMVREHVLADIQHNCQYSHHDHTPLLDTALRSWLVYVESFVFSEELVYWYSKLVEWKRCGSNLFVLIKTLLNCQMLRMLYKGIKKGS